MIRAKAAVDKPDRENHRRPSLPEQLGNLPVAVVKLLGVHAAMIFGSIEPEDADVFFEFRVVEFSGELHDLGFRNRVIGLGGNVFALGGEETREKDEGPDDAVFHRTKEDFGYPGWELLLSFIS